MIKSGVTKSALLLACIGIIVVALVEPIAGHMMGPGNMTGRDMEVACPDNKTHMVHCMMHFMMGNNNSANETMMHYMMGEHSVNESIMHCMMGEKGSCCIVEMKQNDSSAQVRLDCARFWLEKAMELHELHLKDPTTTTNESQIELMNQITRAYECITGESVTSEMINTTVGQAPTGDEHGHQV